MMAKQTRERARIHYRNNCRACQLSKTNEIFRRRVAHAKLFRQPGEATLAHLAALYGFNQAKLYNHAAKHLRRYTMPRAVYLKLMAEAEEEDRRNLLRSFEDPAFEYKSPWELALDEIIAKGNEQLQAGKIRITPNGFISAAKLKSGWSRSAKR